MIYDKSLKTVAQAYGYAKLKDVFYQVVPQTFALDSSDDVWFCAVVGSPDASGGYVTSFGFVQLDTGKLQYRVMQADVFDTESIKGVRSFPKLVENAGALLVGLELSSARQAWAIYKSGSLSKKSTVEVGQKVTGGWTIVSVTPRGLTKSLRSVCSFSLKKSGVKSKGGLYICEEDHAPIKIVAGGDKVNVSRTTVPDLRTVDEIQVDETGFSSSGSLVFTLRFTDKTMGLFETTIK